MEKSYKFMGLILTSPAMIYGLYYLFDIVYSFDVKSLFWLIFWFIFLNVILYFSDFLFVSYLIYSVPLILILVFSFISQIISGETNEEFAILLFIFLVYIIYQKGYDEKITDSIDSFAYYLEKKFKFLNR